MRLLCLSLALAVSACAPKVDVRNPSPFEEDDPAAGPAKYKPLPSVIRSLSQSTGK